LYFKGKIAIDEVDLRYRSKSFSWDSIQFSSVAASISDLHVAIPDTYHSVQIRNLTLDSKKSIFHIDSLKINPQYGKVDFGRRIGHQSDRIEALIAAIDVKNPDVMGLLHHKVIADKILINEIRSFIFRDRRIPRSLQVKPLLMGYLKKIPLQIRVNILKLNHATVVYEEFPEKGSQSGILKIENVRLSLSPFINRPTTSDGKYLNLRVSGSIMGSGNINALLYLPLNSGNYFVKGAINDLDLTTLNSSSENLGNLRIKSGFLDNLSFQFNFNEEKSTGELVGEYHHLILEKLKESEEGKKVARFQSFMLKKIIIPKNKDKTMSESKRKGKINYKRDPTRFISHYFLQSLMTGIKSSFKFGFLLPR
jgi:hypothetical protein